MAEWCEIKRQIQYLIERVHRSVCGQGLWQVKDKEASSKVTSVLLVPSIEWVTIRQKLWEGWDVAEGSMGGADWWVGYLNMLS